MRHYRHLTELYFTTKKSMQHYVMLYVNCRMMSESNTDDSDILYTLGASRSTKVVDECYRVAQLPE
jgi:hypothetical protein